LFFLCVAASPARAAEDAPAGDDDEPEAPAKVEPAKHRHKRPAVPREGQAEEAATPPAAEPRGFFARLLETFYADASLSVGYSKASVPDTGAPAGSSTEAAAPSAPTLLQWDLGATFAYRLPQLSIEDVRVATFAGLTSDFRILSQYSALDPQLGNFRGTRWNVVGPVVGALIDGTYLVKVDLQFLGSYALSNSTVEGASLHYESPFGFRAQALYPVGRFFDKPKLNAGLEFETVSFSRQDIVGVASTPLVSGLHVWQLGVVASHAF
jgi:hypothetical protein